MALYAYKGIAPSGKTVEGVRDAESPKNLRQIMRKEGVVVTDCGLSKGGKKAAVAAGTGKGLNREVDFSFLNRVKETDVAAFTRQLSTLLKAGIPLAESLSALLEQIENVKLKSIVGDVKTAVNEGSSLGDALDKHPQVFQNLYVSMVRAGERAGNLDEVLSRLADFMENAAELRSKVLGAMVYPIIMIVVGVVIMAVLMIAVVPKITNLYADKGAALPVNTRMLIWVANMTGSYWHVFFVLAIAAIFGFRAWTRSESGRPVWHMFILKAPLAGSLVRQIAVARFARTVGTMLESGVPLLQTLDTAKQVLGNVILIKAVEEARRAVTEGESLAVTLRKSGHFQPSVTHMIAVGERSGALEQMLLRSADAFDRDVEMRLGRLTSMLEPLMLVIMGGAVAFVVFSILMPLMDMQKLSAQ